MEEEIKVEQHFQKLLEALSAISPASNLLSQFLFLLPERASTLLRRYPELMEEREEEILSLFGLKYDEKGLIDVASSGVSSNFGYYLKYLMREIFKQLSKEEGRKSFLKLLGQSEEEFRKIDPLRMWIDIVLKYLKEANPKALKVLNRIVLRFKEKPGETLDEGEQKELFVQEDVREEEIPSLRDLLFKFNLIYPGIISSYIAGSPLALDLYEDLRRELEEPIR